MGRRVADADAAVERAGAAGGEAIDAAFDVMDVGRMAILKDPQGAVFAVWEPRARVGADRVNDLGCLVMNELTTPDPEAAASFYGELFGWTTEAVEPVSGSPPFARAINEGSTNATILPSPPGVPPHWRPCFTASSTAAALARVRELGGEALTEPVEIDEGSVAPVKDPQGAVFSVYAGELDP